jgi:arsenite methyltransferase
MKRCFADSSGANPDRCVTNLHQAASRGVARLVAKMNADAKFWDANAESYAASPVKNIAAFERKKVITRESLRPHSVVLELGCGTGSLALEMAPHVAHIHGLDVSAEMLRIANRKKADLRITNVSFHQGTLDGDVPFEAGSFDSVWAYSILHLVADRARTLKTLFDLLAPRGTFVSSTACLADSWIPYGPAIALARFLGKAPAVRSFDRATLSRELRDAGFVDITEHDVGAERMIAFFTAKKPG